MNYLATIKRTYDSESRMFKNISEAREWILSNNNNMENVAWIDEYNDKWERIGEVENFGGPK